MHGRIFVIDTYRDIKKRGELYEPVWEEWEMARWIPGCDYVCESDRFSEDCEWFAEIYHLDGHMQRKVMYGQTVYEVSLEPFIASLKKQREKRIEKIRAELEKDPPDMWRIHYIAWSDSGFWFIIASENSFTPEMGLLEYLERHHKYYPEVSSILITHSYDYHI